MDLFLIKKQTVPEDDLVNLVVMKPQDAQMQ